MQPKSSNPQERDAPSTSAQLTQPMETCGGFRPTKTNLVCQYSTTKTNLVCQYSTTQKFDVLGKY